METWMNPFSDTGTQLLPVWWLTLWQWHVYYSTMMWFFNPGQAHLFWTPLLWRLLTSYSKLTWKTGHISQKTVSIFSWYLFVTSICNTNVPLYQCLQAWLSSCQNSELLLSQCLQAWLSSCQNGSQCRFDGTLKTSSLSHAPIPMRLGFLVQMMVPQISVIFIQQHFHLPICMTYIYPNFQGTLWWVNCPRTQFIIDILLLSESTTCMWTQFSFKLFEKHSRPRQHPKGGHESICRSPGSVPVNHLDHFGLTQICGNTCAQVPELMGQVPVIMQVPMSMQQKYSDIRESA